jgi:hypothetical protein
MSAQNELSFYFGSDSWKALRKVVDQHLSLVPLAPLTDEETADLSYIQEAMQEVEKICTYHPAPHYPLWPGKPTPIQNGEETLWLVWYGHCQQGNTSLEFFTPDTSLCPYGPFRTQEEAATLRRRLVSAWFAHQD